MMIMIIDDDPEEILLFEDACQEINANVQFIQAHDCIEALNLLNQKMPDLIILDINLYPLDGVDCLRTIKQNDKFGHLPVIMFSNGYSQEKIDKAYQEKAEYFFIKPTSIKQMCALINQLISVDWKAHKQVDKRSFFIS